MYPVLFRIGSFEVTSFGAMVAIAALVGLWLFRRELRRSGLPLDAADAGIVGVIGGFLGAKMLWTAEHASEGPISELLFSRGGLSWYGGLIGGIGAGLAYIVPNRIVLGRYLLGASTLRFVIEFIRVNERVAFGLSVAHLVSLAAIAVGTGMLVVSHPTRRAAYSDRNLS